MSWLIVCELLLLQLLFLGFLATAASRIPWWWLRWLLWITGLLALFLLGLIIFVDSSNNGFVRGLTAWEQMLTAAGGYPTRRLYWISMGIGFFAFPIGITAIAFIPRRERSQTRESSRWSLGRLAIMTGVTVALVLGTVTLNDYLICRDLARVEQSATKKAVSLFGPAPPEAENAYSFLRRAGGLAEQAQPLVEFRREPPPPDKSPRPRRKDYRLSPEELAQWQTFFQSHSDIHELCARATKCEKYVPLIDDDKLWNTDEELDEYRALGRFLHAQGHFELTAENPAEAYATAAVMRRTAEHLSRDRRLIVILLAFSFEGMACDLLERAINVRPPTAAEVRTLKRAGFEYRPALQRAVDWCEAEQLAQMANNYLAGHDAPEGSFLARMLYARDDLSSTPLNYQFWRNVVADPYPIPDPDEIPTGTWPRGYARVGEGSGAMTMLLLPSVFSLEDSTASADTRRRLADYALDLTQDVPSISEANLKESLAEVDAPLDPYDGRALRARPRSGGVALYGVGHDRKDDDGAREDYLDGDIVFYLGPEFTKVRLIIE